MADTPAETAAPAEQPATEAPAGPISKEEVEEALKNVIDPELGVNIVDLGLLYGSKWAEDGALILDMTLTTAACPLQDVIEEQVEQNLGPMVDEWRVNWVWMPPCFIHLL